MHTIPNFPLGKVALRGVIRVFLPRMYRQSDTNAIPTATLATIYNKCLRPTVHDLLPTMASHWPADYDSAIALYQTQNGQIRPGTCDIPVHLLDSFAEQFLERLKNNLGSDGRDAYFGHELRGLKGTTVHDPTDQSARERGFDQLTQCLDLDAIEQSEWHLDVALEFGYPDAVMLWKKDAHETLINRLLPNAQPQRLNNITDKRCYYLDSVMQLKDLAGFRLDATHCGEDDDILYIQAYHTEKSVSYQQHVGVFRRRTAEVLLNTPTIEKLVRDFEKISDVLQTCSDPPNNVPQIGCTRLEIRIPLSKANEKFIGGLPNYMIQTSMVGVRCVHWWYGVTLFSFYCNNSLVKFG